MSNYFTHLIFVGKSNRKDGFIMSDDKNIRHRFTVPAADDIVNTWIEKQSNLGFSIRVLIKAFVNSYGYQDATCLEFGMPVRKRGRPPKQAKIRYDQMMDTDDNEYEDTIAEDDRIDDVPQSETIVRDSPRPVKKETPLPVLKEPTAPKEPIAIKESNAESSDALDILMSPGAYKSRAESEANDDRQVSQDEDGFVDPESLFG